MIGKTRNRLLNVTMWVHEFLPDESLTQTKESPLRIRNCDTRRPKFPRFSIEIPMEKRKSQDSHNCFFVFLSLYSSTDGGLFCFPPKSSSKFDVKKLQSQEMTDINLVMTIMLEYHRGNPLPLFLILFLAPWVFFNFVMSAFVSMIPTSIKSPI